MTNVSDEIVKVYLEQGIITRNDVAALDSRPYGRDLKKEFEKLGYQEVSIAEFALPDYSDYSCALYNSNEYSYEEVKAYMFEYVFIKI
ncbi:MAG: hypothetical protein K0R80_1953 [Clostridia bacterium]|jgi:hypothetical protein|nr:hypothetical protein [Clostridia bacterium]